MTVGGISGVSSSVQCGAGMNVQEDSVSKNLKNQIANAQKELRNLSSREDVTAEEKMKKKQELQQEIANLNQQLRQHQMEQRRKQQSSAESNAAEGSGNSKDMKSGKAKQDAAGQGGKENGLSLTSMRSMLSADSAMKQARVQGSVASRMNGKAGVLRAEIKLDGGNTAAKEAELAETGQKAVKAESAQLNTLAKANREMRENAETESGSRADEAGETVDGKSVRAGEKTGGKAAENVDAAADAVGTKAGGRIEEDEEKTGKADKYGVKTDEISGRGVRNIPCAHVDICL